MRFSSRRNEGPADSGNIRKAATLQDASATVSLIA
jgi:hypothetical protein